MAEIALLIDTSKCMACRGCQVACKQWWELPAVSTTNRGTYENPPDLSAETWTIVKFKEQTNNGTLRWLFNLRRCMHCTDAACVTVCPTYARAHDPLGFVTVDQERCIGCGLCVNSCPFEVPKLGSHDVTDRIKVEIGTPRNVTYNCRFCKDRIADGLTPACAKTCPPGAIQFGERDALVEIGRARVDELKAAYPDAYLYGENEQGGLHVMHVLTEEVSVYELPEEFAAVTRFEWPAAMLPAWYNDAVASGLFPEKPAGWPRPTAAPTATPVPTPTSTPTAELPPTGDSLGGIVAPLGYIGAALVGFGMALRWLADRKARFQHDKQAK